jgi:copper chaperone
MKKTIAIEGMSCAHCAKRVHEALAALPGVEDAVVDLAGHSAVVTGEALDEAAIKAAVEEAGYEAGSMG